MRVRMIRDRFVTGHRDCNLRRHLDSVPPGAPIRDIVDKCRVWESHANADRSFVTPAPERTRSVYTVSEPAVMTADQVVATVVTPVVGLADIKLLLKRLLLSVPAPAPPPRPVPAEMEPVLAHLLSSTPAPVPALLSRSTDIETMLWRLLLPGTPTLAPRSNPVSARGDWSSVVCYSYDKRSEQTGTQSE